MVSVLNWGCIPTKALLKSGEVCVNEQLGHLERLAAMLAKDRASDSAAAGEAIARCRHSSRPASPTDEAATGRSRWTGTATLEKVAGDAEGEGRP